MGSGTQATRGGWSRRRFVGAVAGAAAVAAVPAPAAPPEESAPAPRPRRAARTPAAPDGPRPLHVGTYTSVDGGGTGIGRLRAAAVACAGRTRRRSPGSAGRACAR
ncbi:twin-arginine translocation signal domain-containing protein [Streptomyces sp. NPDC001297]|uniref:twin-arginine translocation signal domain-containing protein n=1 Tax=Streptomyces sp. NPDC001297 TaxID=3364559 RepID=UPI003690B8C8